MLSKICLLALFALGVASAGPPSAPEAGAVAEQTGPCPVPSEENLRLAGWNIETLLGSESHAWHRARLGIEGATMAEVEPVTDPAVCAQINALSPMVRDGAVRSLPYRVRGATLVVFARMRLGVSASSGYPAGPIAIENAVLW